MYRKILMAFLAITFSLAARAKDPEAFHGRYFAPVSIGVYWQNGLNAENIFDDERFVPAVDFELAKQAGKAWQRCEKQFSDHQRASGARCIVTAELVTERVVPDEERSRVLRDLQTGVLVAFAATEREAMQNIVFTLGEVKGGAVSAPHRRAVSYLSGSPGVESPGLFLLVMREEKKAP